MASLLTLHVHLVYHILDNLEPVDIFISAYNVCSRLNATIESYRPYQVKRQFLLQYIISFSPMYFSFQQNIIIIPFYPILPSDSGATRGRQIGNCPFHFEVCPSKFLLGSSCPLKFYFFKIVYLFFNEIVIVFFSPV